MTIDEIRLLRRGLGIRQFDLAEACGMPRFKLSLAENGHVDLRDYELAACARVLAQRFEEVKRLAASINEVPA